MKALIAIPTAPFVDYGKEEKKWKPTEWDIANRKWEAPFGRISGDNTLRNQALRETWWKHIPEPIVGRFFVGRTGAPSDDTIQLDCSDKYIGGLVEKIQLICGWALEHDFSKLLKCDDDTFVFPKMFDYLKGETPECASLLWCGKYLAGGPGYVLGRKAMQAVVDTPLDAHPHCNQLEDHWVGECMWAHGIVPHHEGLLLEEPNVAGLLAPNCYSFHPVSPNGMRQMYAEFYARH